jgi:hypothetical protein
MTPAIQQVASVARIEQREIRDGRLPAPDFVSLNPGYACSYPNLTRKVS